MELCYLNGNALDMLKNSLPTTYEKYLTERDNSWVVEVCGENPFVKFRDVDDFELEPLDSGLDMSGGVGNTTKQICTTLTRRTPLNESRTDFFSTANREKNF